MCDSAAAAEEDGSAALLLLRADLGTVDEEAALRDDLVLEWPLDLDASRP